MKWTKEKRRVCNTCHIDAVSTVLYIGFIVTYEKRNDISQKKKSLSGFLHELDRPRTQESAIRDRAS